YIGGTVVDATGAAVAGANVTLKNGTGSLTRSTITNSDGAYVIPGLPGDTYDLSVSARGFQKYTATKIVLKVAEKQRIDITLTVGAITDEVVVTGESVAQVETTSSDLSGTVSGKQITELQLNGRNFTHLATIVPGVSNQTGQDEGTVGVYGNVSFSMNGGRVEYNNWELDGGDNMDNGSNSTLNVYPSIDAIAEFKVLTSNYGAQYGRNGSGTVEVETKSGTNQFHGNVYEYFRNDAMNSPAWFESGVVPEYKKNDYGYTFGGPAYIPHLYNTDKKKTFFFWSEEWHKDIVPGHTFNLPVPSIAERGGDFSDLCNSGSADCPTVGVNGDLRNLPAFTANQDAASGLLAEIPEPTGANAQTCGAATDPCFFTASPAQATNWREELIRV